MLRCWAALLRDGGSALRGDWRAWAEKAGEPAGSQKAFSQTLIDRGFEAKREPGTGGAGFLGIKIRGV